MTLPASVYEVFTLLVMLVTLSHWKGGGAAFTSGQISSKNFRAKSETDVIIIVFGSAGDLSDF